MNNNTAIWLGGGLLLLLLLNKKKEVAPAQTETEQPVEPIAIEQAPAEILVEESPTTETAFVISYPKDTTVDSGYMAKDVYVEDSLYPVDYALSQENF